MRTACHPAGSRAERVACLTAYDFCAISPQPANQSGAAVSPRSVTPVASLPVLRTWGGTLKGHRKLIPVGKPAFDWCAHWRNAGMPWRVEPEISKQQREMFRGRLLEAARKHRGLIRASLCVNGPLSVMATPSVVLGLSRLLSLGGRLGHSAASCRLCLAGVESTDLVGSGQACGRRSTGRVPEVQPFPLAVPAVGEVEEDVASAVPGRAGPCGRPGRSGRGGSSRPSRTDRRCQPGGRCGRDRQGPNWSICTQPGP